MVYLDWIGKIFTRMRIDTDFVEDMGEPINDRFEFDEFSKETFLVPQHHSFLTSSHGLDAIHKTAVGFGHA